MTVRAAYFRPAAWVCYSIILLLTVLLTCFIALNMEPWVPLTQAIAGGLTTIGIFFKLPWGIGQFIFGNFVLIFSFALWSGTQIIEVIPAVYEMAVSVDVSESQLVKILKKWRLVAYSAEITANLIRYSIYGNGFGDIIRDWANWSIYRFNPYEILAIAINVPFVEALCVMIIALVTIAAGRTPKMLIKKARKGKKGKKKPKQKKQETSTEESTDGHYEAS